ILQAKMSISYCVAATLARGEIAESNYGVLNDAEIARLVRATTLEAGTEFTAAYPGKQGAEVSVVLRSGETRTSRMDDVAPATPEEIRARFRAATTRALGTGRASAIEAFANGLEAQIDMGALGRL